jgi:hypothetical protein
VGQTMRAGKCKGSPKRANGVDVAHAPETVAHVDTYEPCDMYERGATRMTSGRENIAGRERITVPEETAGGVKRTAGGEKAIGRRKEGARQGVIAADPRARPQRLQSNRADLLRSLAREPTVSRSVGLVR